MEAAREVATRQILSLTFQLAELDEKRQQQEQKAATECRKSVEMQQILRKALKEQEKLLLEEQTAAANVHAQLREILKADEDPKPEICHGSLWDQLEEQLVSFSGALVGACRGNDQEMRFIILKLQQKLQTAEDCLHQRERDFQILSESYQQCLAERDAEISVIAHDQEAIEVILKQWKAVLKQHDHFENRLLDIESLLKSEKMRNKLLESENRSLQAQLNEADASKLQGFLSSRLQTPEGDCSAASLIGENQKRSSREEHSTSWGENLTPLLHGSHDGLHFQSFAGGPPSLPLPHALLLFEDISPRHLASGITSLLREFDLILHARSSVPKMKATHTNIQQE